MWLFGVLEGWGYPGNPFPPPPPWKCDWGGAGGVGVVGAAGPCTPNSGRPRKGSPHPAGAVGCCFPPFHTSCLHEVGFSSKEGSGLAGVPEREASVTTRVTADAATSLCFLREAPGPDIPVLCAVPCGVSEPMMKCPLSCVFFWPGGGIVHSLRKPERIQASPGGVAGLGVGHPGWLRVLRGCCSGSWLGRLQQLSLVPKYSALL